MFSTKTMFKLFPSSKLLAAMHIYIIDTTTTQ
jgi:hypothetical protein